MAEGKVMFRLGEHGQALAAYRRAAELYESSGSRLGLGNVSKDEARLFFELGDLERAAMAYGKAYREYESVGSLLGQGNAWIGLADILMRMGENEKALGVFHRARELFERSGSTLGLARTWAGEAEVFFRSGRDDQALAAAEKAGELFRRTKSTAGLVNALLTEAEAHHERRAYEKSIPLAEEAIDLIATFRQGFVEESHRTNVDDRIRRAYDLLVPGLYRSGGEVEVALERAEESRSRSLLDLLSEERIGGSETSAELQEQKRRLHGELARVGKELGQASDLHRYQQLLFERRLLDARIQRNLYRRLSLEHRDSEHTEGVVGASRTFGEPLDANGIRALAQDVGPIVLFYAADLELLAFLVLPSGAVRVLSIDLSRDELEERVSGFLLGLANLRLERRAELQAEDIWRTLFDPIAEHLPPSGPITFLPHGPLHGLPFEALIDPETGQRLFERWDVRIAPSASALALARRRHTEPSKDDELIAFAAGAGSSLPAKEARAVARFFPASRQKTFGPTAAEFRFYEEQAPTADHLLIATHGVHTQASRRGTYLQIEPTPGAHDERLTAAEIAAIPLKAELVTLAACDTDRGDALLSDERLTLTRSFLIAGAASVLATRWRIPEDRSTTRFLVDFYEAYRTGGPDGGGMRKDRALTLARRKAVERGEPAQVWAAWVLEGDAR
ncbi:MAG: CHAT domain-containing protein [Holophagales bacterium]|nr:CHAT domain-containing protein [Holophagales bacterium]